MLKVTDLHAYYDKSHILQGVNFYVEAGVCRLPQLSICSRITVWASCSRGVLGGYRPSHVGEYFFTCGMNDDVSHADCSNAGGYESDLLHSHLFRSFLAQKRQFQGPAYLAIFHICKLGGQLTATSQGI